DLGAEPEETHLEALQVVDRLDLGAEPTGGLRANAEAVNSVKVVLGVNLLAQFVATTEPFPGQALAKIRTESHGCATSQRGIFAGVITRCHPAGFDGALGDCVKAFQRRYQRAGFVELDLELSARHALDVLGEANSGGAEVG